MAKMDGWMNPDEVGRWWCDSGFRELPNRVAPNCAVISGQSQADDGSDRVWKMMKDDI
jgi:hypothetical protein